MISIPFSGSKRYSYKNVKEIVEQNNYTAVYEPFGGSCVLSVNLYNDKLVERAVANDYDRFFDLYPEYLNLKDKVVEEGYKRGLRRTTCSKKTGVIQFQLDDTKKPIKTRILEDKERKILQDIINEFVPKKFWKYFSLGNNFTYSAISSTEKIELNDFTLFNAYLKTDKQRQYLKILSYIQMENLDWKDFIKKYQSEINKNSLLILDPPYVSTNQNQYEGQFTEQETKLLISTAASLDSDFIFFNHDINQVSKWLDEFNLDYYLQLTGNISNSANRKRKDVMAYVRN